MQDQPLEETVPKRADDPAEQWLMLHRPLLFAIPMFLALWLFVPNLGPVFRNFTVASASMEPALPQQRTMIVSRAAYGYSPHSFDLFALPIQGRWPDRTPARGDIVTYRLPSDLRTIYVKRVIGLPGETVQMKGGQLYLNDSPVARQPYSSGAHNPDQESPRGFVPAYLEQLPGIAAYVVLETNGDAGPLDNTPPLTVPQGHIFLLGDNRDNSSDSRVSPSHGAIPIDHIIGRVIFVFSAPAPPPLERLAN